MRLASLPIACVIAAAVPICASAQTGGITGTVARADTAAPLNGVLVTVVRRVDSDLEFHSASTNSSGAYSITGLAPGTYYAWTFNAIGFVNEIFDNIPCQGSCSSFDAESTGTPIAVVAGLISANRNFSLERAGRIRGTVTDETTGLPLPGIGVNILAASGGFVDGATTNASGQYTSSFLAPGTYFAYTDNASGYLNEVHNNVPCGINCQLLAIIQIGTQIPVTGGADTTVNIALRKGATVSGVVTSAATSSPLQGVNVVIANAQADVLAQDPTDASGIYSVQGLPAGTYYAFTSNGVGFINEVYNDIPCVGICQSVAGGTPIVVPDGATVTGRNFALTPGGRISGTVLAADSSEPVPAIVRIYSPSAVLVAEAEVDSSGDYITFTGLPTGTYYAAAQTSDEVHVSEIYDNVVCPAFCQPAEVVGLGTPIAVTTGSISSQRNFRLSRGGRITGRVTLAAGGAAAVDVGVQAYGPIPERRQYFGQTDDNGDYEIAGLPPGSYVLHTNGAAELNLAEEIYDNVPCIARCDEDPALAKGARVPVALETTTGGINFALAQAGTISGVVTSAASAAALKDVPIYVLSAAIAGPPPPQFATTYTDASGQFTITGLPTGSYHLYTGNEAGFIDEAFANLPCLGGCPGAAMLGNPIAVTGSQSVTGVNFALDPGGRISGVVRDAVTAQQVGADVDIVDAAGRLIQKAYTGAGGAYITPSGLAAGTYYAAARTEGVHLAEVFGGAPCRGACAPEAIVALGTPIVVTAGATTSGRDFDLDRGAQISGTVLQAGTGVPVEDDDRGVNLYDGAGRFAGLAYFDNGGSYFTTAVPSGTYFGFTTSVTHRNEIFDNIPCPGSCAPSRAPGGTPIAATAGVNTTGINFALESRAGVPGAPFDLVFSPHPQGILIAWQPPENGGVAVSYRLEAGLAPGTTAVSFTASQPQFLAVGAPHGRYYVRVRAINGSGTGSPSPDTVLVVGPGGALPGAPRSAQAWMMGSQLMMTWQDPRSGGDPTHYIVEAGTAAGLANIATISSSRRGFTYTPVPAGFYFLRVRAVNATGASAPSNDVMLVVGGAASPPRAPREVGAAVLGSTVAITWSAPAGPPTGYIIEAGSAPGLSNLAVLPIGPVTTMSFPNIPPGTYYVRVRAVNTRGASVPSEEMVVIVG